MKPIAYAIGEVTLKLMTYITYKTHLAILDTLEMLKRIHNDPKPVEEQADLYVPGFVLNPLELKEKLMAVWKSHLDEAQLEFLGERIDYDLYRHSNRGGFHNLLKGSDEIYRAFDSDTWFELKDQHHLVWNTHLREGNLLLLEDLPVEYHYYWFGD